MINKIERLIILFFWKSSSSRYIHYLRKKGIKVGNNCIFRGPRQTEIDLTRPSLVEIGNNVDFNLNFTILTHDYATTVFLRVYNKFVNSSGKVKIGNNIYFGKNCTILKGVSIGDNCIIGAGSLVTKSIPENSVAAGTPAKVIYSLKDYYDKRVDLSLEEAIEYAKSIYTRYNRLPIYSDFREEFPFFVSGKNLKEYPNLPIKFQLGDSFDEWCKNHVSKFENFDEFISMIDFN
jgi:acetyltransferase-like isoleucine patch superfamily enzyme